MQKYSKLEKVLLVNQYEILKQVDSENREHYEELIDIIKKGYSVFYSMIDEWFGDDMPEDEGIFVLDILDFYTAVELYKKAHPDDKDVVQHEFSTFQGFDGNHETEYMSFVRFLIEKQHKFGEIAALKSKNDNFNSHCTMLPFYRKIITAWKQNGGQFPQTREEILPALNSALNTLQG